MTRQAVEYHVLRIMPRAPLFRRFWRRKNLDAMAQRIGF